jgi:hypothetical protein
MSFPLETVCSGREAGEVAWGGATMQESSIKRKPGEEIAGRCFW